MPSNINGNRADANNNLQSQVQALSYLFKGLLVAASPIGGWAVLKCILSIFNNLQYFFFFWMTILGVGLVAEFFTQTWRPSDRLARAGGDSNRSDGEPTGTVNIGSNNPPTVLFKSMISGGGQFDGVSNERQNQPGQNINEKDARAALLENILEQPILDAINKNLDAITGPFTLIEAENPAIPSSKDETDINQNAALNNELGTAVRPRNESKNLDKPTEINEGLPADRPKGCGSNSKPKRSKKKDKGKLGSRIVGSGVDAMNEELKWWPVHDQETRPLILKAIESELRKESLKS